MKTSSSLSLLRAAAALWVATALALHAQEPAPAAPKRDAAPPPASPTPPAEPTAPAVEAERTPETTSPGLRRIDEPETPADSTTATTTTNSTRRRRSNAGEFPFGDHHVPKGSRVQDAVSVFGSTHVEGEIDGDVVSIMGQTRIGPDAKVGGAAVAVLSPLVVEGPVRGDAVGVLGGVEINAPVRGEVVSVLGNLSLGPKAVIEGDVVIVGGKLTRDPGAVVNGNTVNVPILGGFGDVEWVVTYFKRCVLLGRPLAFGEHMGWAWLIAFSFLGFYVLLALIAPRPLEKCAVTLETRPGSALLASILTVFLTPVAIVLLAVTVIGAVLVPFVGAGLFFAGLFGKAVMLAWLGRRFTRFFGDGPLGHPAIAVLTGGLLVLLLYTIPFFGFMLYKLLSWLGLGVVVYTIALGLKREKPAPPVPPVDGSATDPNAAPMPPPAGAPVAAYEGSGVVASAVAPASTMTPPPVTPYGASGGFVGHATQAGAIGVTPVTPVTTPSGLPLPPSVAAAGFAAPSPAAGANVPPPTRPAAVPPRASVPPITAATMPRATFMIRMAALLLDLVLIGVIVAFMNGILPRMMRPEPPGALLLLAIYGAIMWKLRGTTIGGIVCGLKVVRIDDRPVDWATSSVRALSCFLSLVVAGLGFIWIAIDDEKQSWHDKIAGTVVVRVPKGVSLI